MPLQRETALEALARAGTAAPMQRLELTARQTLAAVLAVPDQQQVSPLAVRAVPA
jgi:hypothetical protein